MNLPTHRSVYLYSTIYFLPTCLLLTCLSKLIICLAPTYPPPTCLPTAIEPIYRWPVYCLSVLLFSCICQQPTCLLPTCLILNVQSKAAAKLPYAKHEIDNMYHLKIHLNVLYTRRTWKVWTTWRSAYTCYFPASLPRYALRKMEPGPSIA